MFNKIINKVAILLGLTLFTFVAIAKNENQSSLINKERDWYVVSMVVLDSGYTLTERRDYEQRIAPSLSSYKMGLEQSYVVKDIISGSLSQVQMINLYHMENEQTFYTVLGDSEYLKNAEFRDEIHNMAEHTIYFSTVKRNKRKRVLSPLMAELIVPTKVYSDAQVKQYERKRLLIRKECGLVPFSSYQIRSKFMGVAPARANALSLWEFKSEDALFCLKASEKLKALNETYPEIFNDQESAQFIVQKDHNYPLR